MRNGAGRKSHRSIRAIPERPSLSNSYIPASDSFDVKLLLSKGSEFGNYSYSIDGKNLGYFAGAAKLDPPMVRSAAGRYNTIRHSLLSKR